MHQTCLDSHCPRFKGRSRSRSRSRKRVTSLNKLFNRTRVAMFRVFRMIIYSKYVVYGPVRACHLYGTYSCIPRPVVQEWRPGIAPGISACRGFSWHGVVFACRPVVIPASLLGHCPCPAPNPAPKPTPTLLLHHEQQDIPPLDPRCYKTGVLEPSPWFMGDRVFIRGNSVFSTNTS